VVLEELAETDAVLLDLRLNLEDKLLEGGVTDEGSLLANVLILFSLVKLLHFFLEGNEGGSIINELEVLDFIVVSSVDGLDCFNFLIREDKAKII